MASGNSAPCLRFDARGDRSDVIERIASRNHRCERFVRQLPMGILGLRWADGRTRCSYLTGTPAGEESPFVTYHNPTLAVYDHGARRSTHAGVPPGRRPSRWQRQAECIRFPR